MWTDFQVRLKSDHMMALKSQVKTMKNGPMSAAVWLLMGMVLMATIVWFTMPSVMLVTHPSAQGYEETVARLDQALTSKNDWRVLGVNDYQKATSEFAAIERTGSMNVCNPRYASRILSNEEDRGVTALMPLAIGVYEDSQGKVYVSRMNVKLLGMMFGGTIAEVMGMAGEDLDQIVDSALSDH